MPDEPELNVLGGPLEPCGTDPVTGLNRFTFDSPELLAGIVATGLPLYAFGLESGGLEQAYLRSGIGQVD